MRDIVIISRYGKESGLQAVGRNMELLFCNALRKLGYNVTYSTNINGELNVYNSIVIFLMPPELYIEHCASKKKNDNIFILWCFEHMSVDAGIKKYYDRYNKTKLLLQDGHEIDYIWMYDKYVFDMFSDKRVKYFPAGYDESMDYGCTKEHHDQILFVGNIRGYRRRFLKSIIRLLRSEPSIPKNVAKFKVFDYIVEPDIDDADIGKYYFAIDIPSQPYVDVNTVGCLRIIQLAANNILIFSNHNLENFGLVDGKHYIHFDNAQQFVGKYIGMRNDITTISRIAANAKQKIMADYNMVKMFKKMFEDIGV